LFWAKRSGWKKRGDKPNAWGGEHRNGKRASSGIKKNCQPKKGKITGGKGLGLNTTRRGLVQKGNHGDQPTKQGYQKKRLKKQMRPRKLSPKSSERKEAARDVTKTISRNAKKKNLYEKNVGRKKERKIHHGRKDGLGKKERLKREKWGQGRKAPAKGKKARLRVAR